MKNKLIHVGLLVTLSLGTIPGFAQSTLDFKYKKFYPLWNKKDLTDFIDHSDNWKVKYPNTDSATIYTDGNGHPGSMTHLIWKKSFNNNMELKATVRMPTSGGANAGIQFRSRCENPSGTLANNCNGQPWAACGPQADMGDSYTGDIYNGCSGAYINQGTQSQPPTKVNTISTCRAASNFKGVDSWNDMLIRIINDTATVLLNNVPCSKLYLSDPNDQKATSKGLISLQYENLMVVEWKNIQLKNLEGTDSIPTSINAPHTALTNKDYQLSGGKSAIGFSIPTSGQFSAKVTDVHGKQIKSIQGNGPISESINVGTSGLYLVQFESTLGSSSHRVLVQ